MKKLFFSLILVAVGSGLWWMLARTARFSVKQWDAKFDTVLRTTLSGFGLTNQDLISSVHEIKKDKSGSWVSHRLVVKMTDQKKIEDLKRSLESSGARVEQSVDENMPVMRVMRGRRIYQEIYFSR